MTTAPMIHTVNRDEVDAIRVLRGKGCGYERIAGLVVKDILLIQEVLLINPAQEDVTDNPYKVTREEISTIWLLWGGNMSAFDIAGTLDKSISLVQDIVGDKMPVIEQIKKAANHLDHKGE